MQTFLRLLYLSGILIFISLNAIAQAPGIGLVAYYPFNGNAIDESGNGHWGYVSGPSLTTDRFGNAARAFSFDGINDLIEIQDQSDLNTLDFTYSMWINISEYGTSSLDGPRIASISMAKYGNTQGFIIYNNPQGQYVIRTHPPNIPATSNDYFTALPIPVNAWKHVVFTKVGQKMCVYVDGSLSSTGSYLGNYTTSPGNLLIGCGPWRLDEFFKGKLDDIRIYNRGLSETEVAQLYDSEKLP
ncbi:LamG domain-containing protein [Spirosoma foliorum]|uniref:LamG domain-containing protein n=1 Tax=Spirosoma foliorum TaxID=2710596 RepID=A0A7G5GW69_9BACT|nr:LamG domain-containing protein [Spirosoma foliorum]QMW03111.1 LamG domain-containing protein [Spirosoma foliorum]